MVLRVASALAASFGVLASGHPLFSNVQVRSIEDGTNALSLCPSCVNLGSQGLNILLNYVLQAGVVGSCGKICSHLPSKVEQGVCELACSIAGAEEFTKAIEKADLDPIFFCELVKACHAGADDAAASLTAVQAQPATVAKGATVSLKVQVNVVNATGVGEFRIAVDGPVTQSVANSFLLPNGLPKGPLTLSVDLQIQDDEEADPPVEWSAGTYKFGFKVCQGECDSKHPHSKVFGALEGTFALTEALKANPTHYGDPKTGCQTDEQAVQVEGVSGDFCSPVCSSGSCPSDVPQGVKAAPQCALQTSAGDQFCALICSTNADCGTASCQKVSGVGLCTYPAGASNLLSARVGPVRANVVV